MSCNVFPTQTSLFAQQNGKDAEAFLELNAKRFNDSSPQYARSWFQIDWMITQESGNHTDDLSWKEYKENNNWEENPDYINYFNGVYCFSKGQKMNDKFQAFVDYTTMLDEAGIEIYFGFGWKIASRIETWFGCDPIQSRTSDPLDLDAYADAAVALFKYMRNEVGLKNFNIFSFYNEPNRTNDHNFYLESDFSTIAPVKQVALFDSETGDPVAAVNCKINGSVTVDAKLLDCEDDDTLEWEIKRYSGAVKTKKKVEQRREDCIKTGTYKEKGSISNISSNTLSMTYTATDKAEKGEVVAIRCTIKDGDKIVKNDRYAVLMVVIN